MTNNARFTHFTGLLRKKNNLGTQIYCSLKCMDQLICIVYSWVLIRFETNALYYVISREQDVPNSQNKGIILLFSYFQCSSDGNKNYEFHCSHNCQIDTSPPFLPMKNQGKFTRQGMDELALRGKKS